MKTKTAKLRINEQDNCEVTSGPFKGYKGIIFITHDQLNADEPTRRIIHAIDIVGSLEKKVGKLKFQKARKEKSCVNKP